MFFFSNFTWSRKTAFIFLLLMIFTTLAFGQTGQIDWGNMGVNVSIVTGILSVTQVLKTTFLKNLPGGTYLALNMALSGAAAFLMRDPAASLEVTMQLVVFYMGAAAYLYNIAKRTPLLKNFYKDGKAATDKEME